MPTAWSQCLKWLLRKRSNVLPKYSIWWTLIGSLSNDDGDGNENGEKAIGLDKQNNNYSRASRFFVHFFAVVARLRRENA